MSLATYQAMPPEVEEKLTKLLQNQERLCQRIATLEHTAETLEHTVALLCKALGMRADGQSHGLRSHGLTVAHLLPKSLQGKYVDMGALDKAVQAGLVCIEDGAWRWQLKSKTLLAYFCGRVWCGDRPHEDPVTKLNVWRRGCLLFPDKELSRLFQTSNLRLSRKQRLDCAVPEGAERIDELFESPT